MPWWRHQMENFPALFAICAGNSPVPGEFPAQRPVTRSFDVFFDLRPNKRLSKQSLINDLRRYRAHYDVIVMLPTLQVFCKMHQCETLNFSLLLTWRSCRETVELLVSWDALTHTCRLCNAMQIVLNTVQSHRRITAHVFHFLHMSRLKLDVSLIFKAIYDYIPPWFATGM